MCHDGESLAPFPSTMPDADKFLFDTNGFVIVRNVFSTAEVAKFHEAVEAHADQIHERKVGSDQTGTSIYCQPRHRHAF